jgi:hypothetical protein
MFFNTPLDQTIMPSERSRTGHAPFQAETATAKMPRATYAKVWDAASYLHGWP